MKNAIIVFLFSIASSVAFGQSDAISKFFPDIDSDENVTRVSISSKMFEMFMHVEPESEEERELLETISDLQGMRIITKENMQDGMAYYRKALKKPSAEYEELLSVSQPDENFTFFVKEVNGDIHEVFMIFGDSESIVLMSIRGLINLQELSRLSRQMNIEGMKYLDQIDDEKN
jgi:hypothetical protein